MKKVISILTILFFLKISSSIAQNYNTILTVEPVMTAQSFYLNGGNRATFGGVSRTYYKVDLPENTVEWYYSVSTSPNEGSSESLNLTSQLTKLVDPTGLSTLAVSAIMTPTGSGVIDIYLCDRTNIDKFIEKVDNWGGSYSYIISGSRINFKQGTIQVKDILSGSWYLGFKNPSATTGINITIEVTAIVKEYQKISKTENEEKADLYGNLGWKAFENGDYNKCLELSKKALSLNCNLPWVKLNFALVQLVKGDDEYLDSYVDAITSCKKSRSPKEFLEAGLKDIYDINNKVGKLKNSEEIIDLLKMEINNY